MKLPITAPIAGRPQYLRIGSMRWSVHFLIGGGLLALGYMALAIGTVDEPAALLLNAVIPLVIVSGCAFIALDIFLQNNGIWSARAWLLVVCSLYYGFGALIYLLGSAESIAHIDTYYFVDTYRLIRSNALNAISIGGLIVVGTFIALGFSLRDSSKIIAATAREYEIKLALLFFLTIGLPAQIYLVLTRADGVPPSWLVSISTLGVLSLAPCLLLTEIGRQQYKLLFVLILIVQMIIAFGSYSKIEILKVLLFVGLTTYWVKGGLPRLALLAAALFTFYLLFLSGFILFLRNEYGLEANREFFSFFPGGVSFASSGQDELADLLPGVQSWWTRLSYASSQAFAMDSYDQGVGFDSLSLGLYAWQPRFIFTDKPLMTIGSMFSALVTGNPDSQTAPGVFAEGYWAAGWSGVLFVTLYVASLTAILERFAIETMRKMEIMQLPSVWVALTVGLQPDSWFAAQYVGVIPTIIGLYIGLSLATKFILSKGTAL